MPLNKPTGEMLNAGSTSAPQVLGTASAGTGPNYSFGNHVHPMPSAAQVGAIPSTQAGSFATTQQIAGITVASIGAMATSERSSYATTAQLQAITPASIGALSTAQAGSFIATSQASSYATTAQLQAITPASIGAIPTSAQSGFATLTGGRLTTTQIPALGGDISLAAGATTAQVLALQGLPVSSAAPTNGQVLQWNGSAWVPGTNPTGGSGGGGLVFFCNPATAPDNPITGLPGTPHELGRVADVGQSTITSATLSQSNYDFVAGFVSDVFDPDTTAIPAGLWDFNVWASSNTPAGSLTNLQLLVYKYNGSTLTLLATSDDVPIYNTSVITQYTASVVLPQTTLLLSDRIYVEFRAKAASTNKTIVLKFGDSTPTHVHTTLPSVGGSGAVFVVDGVFQSPARPIVDSDISTAAAIALSKVAGAASTAQVAAITAQSLGALTTTQAGSWISTAQQSSFATTAQVAAITATSLGAVTTTQITAYATTAQVAAITPASIGAIPTSQAAGFATTAQVAAATTAQLGTIKVGANLSIDGSGVLSATGSAYTSAAPLGLNAGGTGAITAVDALTNLGVPIRSVECMATSAVGGTASGNTFTASTAGVFTGDGYTLNVGEICAFTQNGINNGPWILTTAGTVSVAAVFTRPSWFQGTVKSSVICIRFGTRYGYVFSITPGTTGDIVVGTSTIALYQMAARTNGAGLGGNIFTNTQTLPQGTTTLAPLNFKGGVSGGILTTPAAHSVEWDGSALYVTNSSAIRQRVATSALAINAQTGTAYTLALTDQGGLVTLSNAAAIALTIPLNATVAFPVGTEILLTQLGAGQVTVAAASGATVNGRSGLKTAGQYATVSLVKIATDAWLIAGDTTA